MKSIVISYRVSPKTLARVLDGLWKQNPCFDPDKLSKIGKKTFEYGTNYLIQGLNYEPSDRAKQTLTDLSRQISWDTNAKNITSSKELTKEEREKIASEQALENVRKQRLENGEPI